MFTNKEIVVDTPPRINPGDSRFTDRCPQAGLAQSPRALGLGVSRPTTKGYANRRIPSFRMFFAALISRS